MHHTIGNFRIGFTDTGITIDDITCVATCGVLCTCQQAVVEVWNGECSRSWEIRFFISVIGAIVDQATVGNQLSLLVRELCHSVEP